MDARHSLTLTAISGLLALSCLSTGCASLGKTALWGSKAEVVKGDAADVPGAAAPAGKFIVELRPVSGKARAIEHTIAGPLNVHDALVQAKVIKEYRRMKLELVRPLPSGGWHRMPVEYDRTSKRVAAECDYAILPGDRLIVTEDPTTILGDMMDSATNGAGFMGTGTAPKSGKTKYGTFRVAG
ncbi:hypothetical protein ETAA8_26520 [Anatilimnocola aggregata]|uniref:Uncharacterized protein n=1 Tax=Anatilimnocola aggregata TaxID=2528021 RepID=A0A517YBH0_9BACT|nr:hypothetical protein [Anatilimnocola aggregata]QDU27564.1 hypothetical protein ETAA8_26520 [Anatilimnocola aggregata]